MRWLASFTVLITLCTVSSAHAQVVDSSGGSSAASPSSSVDDQVANSSGTCAGRQSGSSGLCGGSADTNSVITVVDDTTAVTRTGNAGSGSGKRYVAYDRVVSLPNGGFCIATGYREEGTAAVD